MRCGFAKMGAVPPFSFDQKLSLVADARLTEEERVVFSAGRLDFSIVMKTSDYLMLSGALILPIAEPLGLGQTKLRNHISTTIP